jgi:hypothetical protein
MIRLVSAAVLGVLLTQLASCEGGTVGVSASYPDAYWDGPAYDYYPDYFYGPPVIYGGWGPGYYVGPPRWDGHPHDGDGHPHDGAGQAPQFPHDGRPGFRPSPPGRPAPSIPSGPRGGGTRGGPR